MLQKYNGNILIKLFFLLVLIFPRFINAQDTSKTISIYIDCSTCDIDYINNEISYVNFVRSPKFCDVFVLVTQQTTGSGGTEYVLTFIGRKDFAGLNDTLKFSSKPNATDEIVRKNIVKVLKLGIIRYLARTNLSDNLNINYDKKNESQPKIIIDKWKNWVFSLSLNSFFNIQKSTNYFYINSSASANKITPDIKIELSANTSYNESNYNVEDYNYKNVSRSQSFNSLIVKSIDEHWSAGTTIGVYSSLYSNIKFSYSLSPALEYNLFRYSESTRKQLRFQYKLGYNYNYYNDSTIYFKIKEGFFSHGLSVAIETKQIWGSISTSVSWNNYLYDFKKNYLSIYSNISFNILGGLALNFSGGADYIHNQISLPKYDASIEDILLQRRSLESQYYYWGNVGLSYTFGSIYNNVVNPRFGM